MHPLNGTVQPPWTAGAQRFQPAAGCIHGLLRLRLENLKVVQTVYAAGCWLKTWSARRLGIQNTFGCLACSLYCEWVHVEQATTPRRFLHALRRVVVVPLKLPLEYEH
jgi:hypothetical protein